MTDIVSIFNAAKERVGSDSLTFPVFIGIRQRLQQMFSQENFRLNDVIRLIMADTGLAVQVLRSANSTAYSGLPQVATIHQAAHRLGPVDILKVVASLVTDHDQCRSPIYNLTMDSLWKHAFCCAAGNNWIACRPGYEDLAKQAVIAGLLHDVGKLFLLEIIDEMLQDKPPTTEAMTSIGEVLDCLHVPLGNLLMRQWQMPDLYCQVVSQHEEDQWDEQNTILAMVRLTNLTCKRIGIGLHHNPKVVPFATREAELLGLTEVVVCELEMYIEDVLKVAMRSLG